MAGEQPRRPAVVEPVEPDPRLAADGQRRHRVARAGGDEAVTPPAAILELIERDPERPVGPRNLQVELIDRSDGPPVEGEQAPAQLGDRAIATGDSVVCAVEPLAAPAGPAAAALTFGYGLRPCPGPAQALALAAGVIDAVREHSA